MAYGELEKCMLTYGLKGRPIPSLCFFILLMIFTWILFLGFQEGDRTFIVDFNTLHSLPQRRMCIKNLGVLLDWLSFFFGRFQVICILYFTTSVAKRGVGESTV